MTKKKSRFVFVFAVGILVLSALACVFPAVVEIEDGVIPSAIDEGHATMDLKNGGCDCETNVVSGKFKYTDGSGPNKVHFTGKIDHTVNPGCEVPEDTNLWATGTYYPSGGTFNIGLFGPIDSNYDQENCSDCDLCWRIWLVGGEYDGYQNWACTLENEDALTYEDHPSGSDCASATE